MTLVLGHAICAQHHLNNGDVNAIMLPHSLRFNARAVREASELAAGFGGSLMMPARKTVWLKKRFEKVKKPPAEPVSSLL